MTTTLEQKTKRAIYLKAYHLKNKDRHAAYMRKRRSERPDVVETDRKRAREYARGLRAAPGGLENAARSMREWRAANPGVNAERCRKWQKRNPEKVRALRARNRLAIRLRSRLYSALRAQGLRKREDCSAVRDLGCTIPELREHMKNQFTLGMSWDNYGKWHIDHRQPLASFELADPEQVRNACHYTNLQPLWAIENHQKHAKLDWQEIN